MTRQQVAVDELVAHLVAEMDRARILLRINRPISRHSELQFVANIQARLDQLQHQIREERWTRSAQIAEDKAPSEAEIHAALRFGKEFGS